MNLCWILAGDTPSTVVIEGFKAMLPYLQKWDDRDRKTPFGIHEKFACLVGDLKEYFKEYDKNMAEENYEPGSEKKKKSTSPGSLKLKIRKSVNGSEKKSKEKTPKLERLPKKDSKSVKNIFSQPTLSGRKAKPAEWVKQSIHLESGMLFFLRNKFILSF